MRDLSSTLEDLPHGGIARAMPRPFQLGVEESCLDPVSRVSKSPGMTPWSGRIIISPRVPAAGKPSASQTEDMVLLLEELPFLCKLAHLKNIRVDHDKFVKKVQNVMGSLPLHPQGVPILNKVLRCSNKILQVHPWMEELGNEVMEQGEWWA